MDEQAYRERLAQDLESWRRDGLISEAQQQAILAHAGAPMPRYLRGIRLAWLVSAAALVGAIVLAAGIVLLFAANWEEMPSALRVALLMAGILAAYGAGYALMYRYDMQRIGSALFLLAVLLYHASIFLIAQIYNMPTDSAALWLLAAAGTFPLAYLFGSRIVLLLALADTTVWLAMSMFQRYPDTPETQASLLVLGAFAVALYAIGRAHTLRPSLAAFSDVYMFGGLLVLLGLVYIFSFDEPWDEVVDAGAQAYAAPVVVYIAIAFGAALVAAVYLAARATRVARLEAAVEACLLGLAAVVATWPVWSGYAIVFNAVYFAIVIGLIVRGNATDDDRYVNLGLAALALGLLTRYVDVFWTQLATSAFFIIGGLLLFAVAFGIEWLRRRLASGGNGGARPPAGQQGAAI